MLIIQIFLKRRVVIKLFPILLNTHVILSRGFFMFLRPPLPSSFRQLLFSAEISTTSYTHFHGTPGYNEFCVVCQNVIIFRPGWCPTFEGFSFLEIRVAPHFLLWSHMLRTTSHLIPHASNWIVLRNTTCYELKPMISIWTKLRAEKSVHLAALRRADALLAFADIGYRITE